MEAQKSPTSNNNPDKTSTMLEATQSLNWNYTPACIDIQMERDKEGRQDRRGERNQETETEKERRGRHNKNRTENPR